MSWTDSAITILRNLINDVGPTVTYSHERLEELLISSSFLTNVDINCISKYIVDMVTLTVSPDPLTINDYAFIYLCVLRAKMVISETEYILASNKAFSFRDGPASIDGRSSADAKKQIYENAKKGYDRARLAYLANDVNIIRAIIGPHNIDTMFTSPNYRSPDGIIEMFS